MSEQSAIKGLRCKHRRPLDTCSTCRIYVCGKCQRVVSWDNGAADGMPDACDDCWAKEHSPDRGMTGAALRSPLPEQPGEVEALRAIRKRHSLNAQTLAKAPEDERLRERMMNRDIGALLAHIDGASATEEPLYPRGWVDDSDPQKALAEVMGHYDNE